MLNKMSVFDLISVHFIVLNTIRIEKGQWQCGTIATTSWQFSLKIKTKSDKIDIKAKQFGFTSNLD